MFQDVKVIAIPSINEEGMVLNSNNAKIVASPAISNLSALTDNNPRTGINLPGNNMAITFTTDKPFTARSLTIQTTPSPFRADAELQVKGNNNEFSTVSRFVINRSNPALNVGFDRY